MGSYRERTLKYQFIPKPSGGGVDDTFIGTANVPIATSASSGSWVWWNRDVIPSPTNYPAPLYDGNGNLMADMSNGGQANTLAGYGGTSFAIANVDFQDDMWSEIVYQRSPTTGAFCRCGTRYPWPAVDSVWGVQAQQGGTSAAPTIRVWKDFNTQIPGSPFACPSAVNGVDHTMRLETQGAVYRVYIDSVLIVNYTDPAPVHGTRASMQIDVSSTLVQADVLVRSYKAGKL